MERYLTSRAPGSTSHKPFTPKLAKEAFKYWSGLDAPTRLRIKHKIDEICLDPFDIKYSKPLEGTDKRSARVGSYRILFLVQIEERMILIAHITPRGHNYREI